jgi:hypothetical protein
MQANTSNAELERIYREANGVADGKRAPLTTEAVFTAMRAAMSMATQAAIAAEHNAYDLRCVKAIERAKVFDDGSDGTDAESARSVVAILSEVLTSLGNSA